MGRACSTNGGEEECIGYWRESQKERDNWEDQKNITMDLGEMGWDGVDWIDMAQDMDQWRALVNMVLHIRVP
jgi:hypothetical protein